MGVIAAVSTVLVALLKIDSNGLDFFFDDPQKITKSLQQRADDLEQRVESLEKAYMMQTNNVGENVINQRIAEELLDKIETTDKKVLEFEKVFLSDTEKALTVPMMKRDIEGLTTEVTYIKQRIIEISQMMTESASQVRWVIGTLALGILALIAPVVKSVFVTSSNNQ